MFGKNASIKKKMLSVILMTCGLVLLMTCATFFAYEFLTFKRTAKTRLSTLGKIISANSTAALAFESKKDAGLILAALRAEPHIRAASLYDAEGNLFAHYPDSLPVSTFPEAPAADGYRFRFSGDANLSGYQPVMQGGRRLGTLYIKTDLEAVYERFILYGGISFLAVILSFICAYFISGNLQKKISNPILALAETAKAFSIRQDYSVRAVKESNDEIGLLTDTFNQMLTRVQEQNEEILLFNQELEKKVADRTMQFEIVNKELEAFSYSVSHDLRAPLRAVDGYAKMLEEDYEKVFDAEGKRLLSVIQKNAKTMGTLIDDLLNFSRLGRTELNKSSVDMTELVENILAEINKSVVHRADIHIHPLHPVLADRSSISQAIINLLSNAIKYSSHTAEPLIEVKSHKQAGEIVYSFSDNGAGFDNKYVDKLFGVFQRLHSNEEFEGTGVGLALVKRVVTKHGGKVWASGEVGKGAVFSFSLPDINNG